MKGKSVSTPPLHLGHNHFLPKGKHKSVDKKGSDPTPLRNSVLSNELQPVSSPASLRNSGDGDGDADTASVISSTRSVSMGGRDSASSSMYPGTSTASSSTSYLAVPLIKDIHGSRLVEDTNGSTENTPTSTPAPGAVMERSVSRQTMSKSKSTSNASTHRSGTTANKPLDKNHTCTWDQELHFQLRIPISKAEKGSKSKPTLGEGPKSASGLRLMIQQLPTPSATTIAKPSAESESHHTPSHSAMVHKASTSVGMEKQDSEDGVGRHGSHHAKAKVTAFGRVDIDLAAFAGRGRTTRKFLLGGSRTNASVQISVEMNFVGGDKDWVA